MRYLNLEILKKHLNIDSNFDDDDFYLNALYDAAEDVVSKKLDRPLSDLENEDGMIPAAVCQAMLLWIGTMYAFRESVSSTNLVSVPHAFDMLIDVYKNYNMQKSNYTNK